MPKDKSNARRRRAKKHPKAPKRALSAYMIFGKAVRPEIIAQVGDVHVTEIMREIGRRWGAMSEEEKQPYELKAQEDKQRYAGEMSTYDGPMTVQTRRGKKDPNMPKRAMSAYMYFAEEIRPEVKRTFPDLPVTEVMKEIARRWQALSEEDRKPYDMKADEDKKRYDREKADYATRR
eukprot:GILK01001955.1.p1 GENE.GILK01001955.1~~GILK01001955.1.p1  ORF type:complete len:177 (+),score=34.17 GILK01001955.1:82-612(+)